MITSTNPRKRSKRLTRSIVTIASFALIAAACGGDDDADDAPVEDTADAPAEDTAESSAETTDDQTTAEDTADATADDGGDASGVDLDANGDGEIVVGVATPGPRDDGAFYQALVDKVIELAAVEGFADPIIVDNIPQADAETEMRNLAAQSVDIMVVGASEIAEPMPALAEEFSDLYWYCACGQGFTEESEYYSMSRDDGTEINYTSGVATGLMLQDTGGDSASFIGCCELGFETESFLAFEMGLQAVDPAFEATYIPTGDFNDIAAATEAFNNAVSEGSDAIYPFLGGAHEPLVQLANEAGVITMSAGASDVCDRTDLDYQIAVRFDAGDYLDTIFAEILDGTFAEGTVREFHVGIDPQPGAIICEPTAEQTAALDEAYALVASGDLADDFYAIKAEAYGF